MIDKKDEPDIEALRLLNSGEFSHIQRTNRTLAVISEEDEVYTMEIGKIENSVLKPQIGGKVEIRGAVPSPDVVSVRLPD